MKKHKTIEETLNTLYNKVELTYSEFVSLPGHKNKSSLFFAYIQREFDRFIEIVNQVDNALIVEALTEFGDFEGVISKRRFINLLKKISDESLKILKECYYPNPAQALKDLEYLLGMNNRKLMPYIVEQLINYCTFDYPRNNVFYRVRDANADEVIDNCWHTPYYMRQNAYSGRFSSPGFPCLYISDSPETCYAELGELKENMIRWLGKFRLKENIVLGCLDLRLPKDETIKNSSPYEQIQYFLTYPIRLLCTTYAEHKSDSFGEEYLFSQALINLLSHPLDENSGMSRVSGILYDSTKNPGGINIALPAKSIHLPPDQNETYSQFLQVLFQHEQPSIVSLD